MGRRELSTFIELTHLRLVSCLGFCLSVTKGTRISTTHTVMPRTTLSGPEQSATSVAKMCARLQPLASKLHGATRSPRQGAVLLSTSAADCELMAIAFWSPNEATRRVSMEFTRHGSATSTHHVSFSNCSNGPMACSVLARPRGGSTLHMSTLSVPKPSRAAS